MKIRIYVEGGGQTRNLKSRCRQGFRAFLLKAGLPDGTFRITASGPRNETYSDFCNALHGALSDEFVVLLVDSESEVATTSGAWQHLRARDNWERPVAADDHHAHLMVQCMESWFLADKEALVEYFGREFNLNALPARKDVENVDRADVLMGLKNATRPCQQKKKYHKGRHSFELLARIDPGKVIEASPYTRRLIKTLTEKVEG